MTDRILAIEDDTDTLANMRDILELDGYQVDGASRVSEALHRSDWSQYSAILLDRRLPDGTAEDLLPRLVKLAPNAAVLVVTAHADLEGTLTALRHGVSDYILKPINPDALLSSLHRISRVREAEERAQQAERLAAVGEMMAVLAHESRNAFQLAGANLDLLALLLDGNDEASKLVERIRKQQTRVSHLFEDVRGYSAPIQLDLQPTDISDLIQSTVAQVRMLNPDRKLQINVNADSSDAGPLSASIDSSRIEQVFRNLLENSIAACPDPVEITIDCSVCVRINGIRKSFVEIRFRDNGPGLSRECRRRLFEPFFTTKSKGTGLGMAISHRIIEAHGGSISVVSSDGSGGAEFLIALPDRDV